MSVSKRSVSDEHIRMHHGCGSGVGLSLFEGVRWDEQMVQLGLSDGESLFGWLQREPKRTNQGPGGIGTHFSETLGCDQWPGCRWMQIFGLPGQVHPQKAAPRGGRRGALVDSRFKCACECACACACVCVCVNKSSVCVCVCWGITVWFWRGSQERTNQYLPPK